MIHTRKNSEANGQYFLTKPITWQSGTIHRRNQRYIYYTHQTYAANTTVQTLISSVTVVTTPNPNLIDRETLFFLRLHPPAAEGGPQKPRALKDTLVLRRTVISGGIKLVRRSIGSEPLVNGELTLWASEMRPSCGDLNVVAVPSMVAAGSIRCEIEPAEWGGEARCSTGEDVEISPLEVVIICAHQAAPILQIRDLHAQAVRSSKRQAYLRVRSAFPDASRPDVDCVNTGIVIISCL